MELAGKSVLLTGGSAGIGRELAILLKAEGANVVITGRNADRLEAMRTLGIECIAADISSAAGVDALVAQWGDRALDVLINNAGQLVDHDFRKGPVDPDATDDCIYAKPQRAYSADCWLVGKTASPAQFSGGQRDIGPRDCSCGANTGLLRDEAGCGFTRSRSANSSKTPMSA